MYWTEDDQPMSKIESFPKMYLNNNAYFKILHRIQSEEAKILKRKKRNRLIQWSVWASTALLLTLLITSLFATEMGRHMAWRAWVQLNGNIVNLADGVIVQFKDYTITKMDLEHELTSTRLEETLKTLIVYEEAVSKGFEPNLEKVEDELNKRKAVIEVDEQAKQEYLELLQLMNITEDAYWQRKRELLIYEDVVNQYFVYMFGFPYFPEKPLPTEYTTLYNRYIQETDAYKDLSFKRYKDEVVFNKAYDFVFEWHSFIKKCLGTADQPEDVLVSYLGKPLLTVSTIDFKAESISTEEVGQRIGFEALYQEALSNYYSPDKSDVEKVDTLQQQYHEDPVVYEQLQKEMLDRGLSEEAYWSQRRLMAEKTSVINKYFRSKYPDILNMNDDDAQKAMKILANEQFQRAKPLLVFNERLVRKYGWDVKTLTTVGNDKLENYIIAEFRGTPLYSFEISKYRFNKLYVDSYMMTVLLSLLVEEKGYVPNDQAINIQLNIIKQYVKMNDVYLNEISEFMRNTGFSREAWEDYIENWALINALNDKARELLKLDAYGNTSSQRMHALQEEYKELWDEVKFNPDYPLAGEY